MIYIVSFICVLDLKFGILGVHIAPEQAVEEIDALVDVFNSAKRHWNTEVSSYYLI